MSKTQFTVEPCFNQERPIYHDGFPIGHPEFSIEASFCARINKICGIAGLFEGRLADESRGLTEEECWGISTILRDAAEELRTISYHILKYRGGKHE